MFTPHFVMLQTQALPDRLNQNRVELIWKEVVIFFVLVLQTKHDCASVLTVLLFCWDVWLMFSTLVLNLPKSIIPVFLLGLFLTESWNWNCKLPFPQHKGKISPQKDAVTSMFHNRNWCYALFCVAQSSKIPFNSIKSVIFTS